MTTMSVVLSSLDPGFLYQLSGHVIGEPDGEILREWLRDLSLSVNDWPYQAEIPAGVAAAIKIACRAELSRGTDLGLARYADDWLGRFARASEA